MRSGESMANDVDVDLGRLFAGVKRNWWRIALFTLLVTAVVFVLLSATTSRYRAETRVLIESRESVYTRPEGASADDQSTLDAEGVASQVEVITSTEILAEVVRELDLGSRPEFEDQPSLLGRVLTAIGLRSSPTGDAANSDVVDEVRENLDVYRVENSRVIIIQFSSEDPELAAQVPNAIADAYLASLRAAEQQSNSSAMQWLEPEIANLRQQVQEAERRVADFRGQSDLLIGQNNTVLATQQLGELSTELSQVRANRSAAESELESVRTALQDGAELDSLPGVQNSAFVQALRTRQVEIESQIAELSTTYLGNHPRVRALQSQLADIDAQIRAEGQKVLDGLRIQVDAARRRESDLIAEVNRLKAESVRADEEQVQLRALEREATAQRQLLESYLTRYREASARGDRGYLPVDARIFSRAVVPSEPYFPKTMPLTAAAFAASLLFMVIVTLLQELFSGRAMRPAHDHVEPAPQVNMPAPGGTAPLSQPGITSQAATAAAASVAAGKVASSEGETQADEPDPDEMCVKDAAQALISSGVSRAIFVSPEGDEAAASAVLVARAVADAGKRVILIDLTASGAASRPMLENNSHSGITDLLASKAQFADVIHADRYSACHIIPIGTADRAQAMRAIDRLPIIIGSLVTAYDLVVVECGAADVESVEPLAGHNTQLLISALDPDENSVAETAEEFQKEGFEKPLLVTPGGEVPPPAPDRDVA